MAFQYRKNDNDGSHGTVWTSYSDLFMGLAFVFLLLYVVASLRTGATAIQQKIQMDKVTLRNEDLANQLKAYESIKNQYLTQEASPDDEKLYGDLMEKLDLLEDEAKKEKEDLAAASQNLAKKEKALNKYQQLVRNMVNSNMVAKTRIKKRDNIIGDQDVEIREQGAEITDLKSTIEVKRAQIAQGERKITVLNDNLNRRLQELKGSYAQQQMTKKKYEEEAARLRKQASTEISGLREQNSEFQGQLKGMTEELQNTQAALTETKGQAAALGQQLAGKEEEFRRRSAALQGAFEDQRAKDRAIFEDELSREKLSAAAKAAKEAEFRAKAAAQQRKLEGQIGGLRDSLLGTQKELATAKAELEARKKIAQDIKKAFERAGVKGDVDLESGDVTLDFGDHYFETNKADLKKMEDILNKAIPAYAKSLFANKSVAERISGVEIIGFASPTYKGRVVNPESLDEEDRKAAEYNLDLSYRRARSIFQHVFNPDKMSFGFQKQMRSMAKVSGKSFFEENKVNRDLASLDVGSFCKKVDCKKSQKVLIKFSVNSNQRSSP